MTNTLTLLRTKFAAVTPHSTIECPIEECDYEWNAYTMIDGVGRGFVHVHRKH